MATRKVHWLALICASWLALALQAADTSDQSIRGAQEAPPACGSIYFNNHVPGSVDQRLLFVECDIMSGPEWKAQLCLYSIGQPIVPLGSPLTFLSGTDSGYLDTSSGESILCVPGFSPGETAQFIVRFWRGATFEEAETNFMVQGTEPFTVQLGGGTLPPATLSTLQGRPPTVVPITPSIFETFETGVAHFERAPFSSYWPGPVRWQKLSGDDSWVDLPGQTNSALRLTSVSLVDGGQYRFVSFSFCDHPSEPATLEVHPLPPVLQPRTVDPSFYVYFSGIQTYLISNRKVYSLALGPNDEIFVGGHFTIVNDTPWNGVARLNNDGSLNQAFHPPVFQPPTPPSYTNEVRHIDAHKIFVQPDGTVWAGAGTYLPYLPDGTPGPKTIPGNPFPTAFPDGGLLRDGKFLLVVSSYVGENSAGSVFHVTLERYFPDGRLDMSFHPPIFNSLQCCSFQPIVERANGQIYVAGNQYFGPDPNKPGLVRLNVDGSLDTVFSVKPGFFDAAQKITAMGLQPNGRIVIAGGPVRTNRYGSGIVPETKMCRINPDGSADLTFLSGTGPAEGNDEPDYPPAILALAIQRDGHILAAGDFQKFDGIPRDGLVRLYGDPTSPLQLSITRAVSDSLQLHLNGTGDIVAIESATDLSSSDWQPLTTISLSETNTVLVSAGQNQSFYRARALE